MNWSPQQESALRDVEAFMKDPSRQVFYLAGYAGTGKTTLAQFLADPRHWKFAAYTGKAAQVMRSKGCTDASTIHSLIYRPAGSSKNEEMQLIKTRIDQLHLQTPVNEREIERLSGILDRLSREDRRPKYALWDASPLLDWDVRGVVIDECSMVGKDMGADLLSFNKKILVLGDPAQLPPVGGEGFFTSRTPDVLLTEIHRHAKDSPILRLATYIREGGSIRSFGKCDGDLTIWQGAYDAPGHFYDDANQILVGRNVTRNFRNRKQRTNRGANTPGPLPGERLVCLRNDRALGLFNGSQWKVTSADNHLESRTCDLELEGDDGSVVRCAAWMHHFLGDGKSLKEDPARRDLAEFDFAYAMTVHKSQGSQWPSVTLLDESYSFASSRKEWLYTGVTRAAGKLTVLLP